MFILPLGIITYFWDKKTQKNNKDMFNSYVQKILNSELPTEEKIEKIDHMYYDNGYTLVKKTDTLIIVEKKHFNLGLLFIMFGVVAYLGIFIYLVYYKYFLKPERVEVSAIH
jgi:hypothetical protein